jgi:hypothetical protein
MTLDNDKIDRAVLALLYLGLHDDDRTWMGFDWEATNRSHEQEIHFRSAGGKPSPSSSPSKASLKRSDCWDPFSIDPSH